MVDSLFDLFAFPHQEKKHRMHDIDLTNFSEDELQIRFRFGRDSIFGETSTQRSWMTNFAEPIALSPTVQVLVALRFLASGSFLQVIGDTVGLPKSTVFRTIWDVSAAFIQKRNQFSLIGFPGTRAWVLNIILLVSPLHQSHEFRAICKNHGELHDVSSFWDQ